MCGDDDGGGGGGMKSLTVSFLFDNVRWLFDRSFRAPASIMTILRRIFFKGVLFLFKKIDRKTLIKNEEIIITMIKNTTRKKQTQIRDKGEILSFHGIPLARNN